MDSRDLELSRPCPIDLDSLGVDRRQKRVFCSHCSAHVTDISKMREAEAAAFVAANRGAGVCISYLRDSAGNVRFADSDLGEDELGADEAPARRRPASPIVSIDRLRRPAVRRAAAVAALALAACTPHAEHDERDGVYVESVDEVVMERASPEIPLAAEPSELPPVVEEVAEVAEVVAPEVAELADEPCDPTTKTTTTTTTKKAATERTKPRRGRLKREPTKKKFDLDRIDGGI